MASHRCPMLPKERASCSQSAVDELTRGASAKLAQVRRLCFKNTIHLLGRADGHLRRCNSAFRLLSRLCAGPDSCKAPTSPVQQAIRGVPRCTQQCLGTCMPAVPYTSPDPAALCVSSSRLSSCRAHSWLAHILTIGLAADIDKVPATRLRVERQVHLPASRDEAWLALQSLTPAAEWDASAQVFSALESIYR